jgi:hypothetical protein
LQCLFEYGRSVNLFVFLSDDVDDKRTRTASKARKQNKHITHEDRRSHGHTSTWRKTQYFLKKGDFAFILFVFARPPSWLVLYCMYYFCFALHTVSPCHFLRWNWLEIGCTVLNFVICCMREQLCYVIIICICHYIVFATDVYARPPWVLFSPCIQYLSMSFSAMKLEEIWLYKILLFVACGNYVLLATTVQYVIIIICIYSTVHRFCYRQPELCSRWWWWCALFNTRITDADEANIEVMYCT